MRTQVRARVAAGLAAAVAGLALAPGVPSHAAEATPTGSSTDIVLPPIPTSVLAYLEPYTVGDPVRAHAVVGGPTGRPVTLWRLDAGVWVAIATATTGTGLDPGGHAQPDLVDFTGPAGGLNQTWRVTVPAVGGYTAAAFTLAPVTVSPRTYATSLRLISTRRSTAVPGRVTFTFSVSGPSRAVHLYRWYNAYWAKRWLTTTSSRGRASFTFTPPRGRTSWRGFVPSRGLYEMGVTSTFRWNR